MDVSTPETQHQAKDKANEGEFLPRPFPRQRVRVGLITTLIGFLVFLVGARPGLFHLDRSPVIGWLQIAVFLIGLAIICLGGYLSLASLWRRQPSALPRYWIASGQHRLRHQCLLRHGRYLRLWQPDNAGFLFRPLTGPGGASRRICHCNRVFAVDTLSTSQTLSLSIKNLPQIPVICGRFFLF